MTCAPLPSTGHLTRNRDDAWERLKKKHLYDAMRDVPIFGGHLAWCPTFMYNVFFFKKLEQGARYIFRDIATMLQFPKVVACHVEL